MLRFRREMCMGRILREAMIFVSSVLCAPKKNDASIANLKKDHQPHIRETEDVAARREREIRRSMSDQQPQQQQQANSTADGLPSELSAVASQAKQYLEDNVAFVLLQGLKSLARERPENPADYLALYLLQRNPNTRDYSVEIPLRNANAPSGPT